MYTQISEIENKTFDLENVIRIHERPVVKTIHSIFENKVKQSLILLFQCKFNE